MIGRSDYCSIVIAHSSISRLHACILTRGRELFIHDFGSRNGTFVNENPVGSEPVPIRLGDVIRLGNVDCSLEENDDHGLSTQKIEECGPLHG